MCNTKFSLNQKIKAIDGCGDWPAAPYNGQIGTIITNMGAGIRPYRVQFSDGVIWRYDENEIEPVQGIPRPKVGDAVIIARPCFYNGEDYQGEIGIIEHDDGSDMPYCVRLNQVFSTWFKQSEILPASKQHQIFAKLKPGMRVKTTRNGWLIVVPASMASKETDCGFVLWNDAGCCERKDSILDELCNGGALYTKKFLRCFHPIQARW